MAFELPTTSFGTRVFSGARAMFFFNSIQVAYASGLDATVEIQYEPVEVLDNLPVKEHVPVGYRVTLSASIFRTIASGAGSDVAPGSLSQQGIFPKFGDKGQKILQMSGVTCVVQDRNTGKAVMMFLDVKPASQNFSIAARSIVGQNVNFVTTRMLDEGEIQEASRASA